MKRSTKLTLILAAVAAVLGLLLSAGVLLSVRFDFMELSSEVYVRRTYDVAEDFDSICVILQDTDVTFALSPDGRCWVDSLETDQYTLQVYVEDNILTIEPDYNYPWYAMTFAEMKATVYLPKTQYISIQIEQDTGDVEMPGAFTFETARVDASTSHIAWSGVATDRLDIATSTGNIRLSNAQCDEVELRATTGNVYVTDSVAGKIQIDVTTGNVNLARFDAGDITVETSTGNITCQLLSPKLFAVETSTGNVIIPPSDTGGPCKLETSTGNITVTIAD